MLPPEFSGQIVIVGYDGGVSRIEVKTIRTAPKAERWKRTSGISREEIMGGERMRRRQHSDRCQLNSLRQCVPSLDSDGHRVRDE